ncbi:hypothetical protein LVJ94_07225 [Pendulispora rubella]|uniref:MoxR-vWA-beta-propeller ternary system domain-containing protein n=1 Tax=Pendulispora rubella TaxID=2741070 RepID=A0ABZ2L810_9BACT
MSHGGIAVTFSARGDPLEPVGVVGVGPAALALARRVLAEDDAALAAWRGVVAQDAVFLLGAGDTLPWVDGAHYLGQDPAAPRILLPTTHRPNVPLEAFERALLRHAASLAPPLAILLEPRCVVSLAEARPLARELVQKWLEARS